jgi:hypothetical protein
MAHEPRGFVRAETHEAINLKGAHSLLASQHEVDDFEPVTERLVGIFENGSRDMGEPISRLRSTFGALPVPRIVLQLGGANGTTARAVDALRPTPTDQIGTASIFIGEQGLKLGAGQLMDGSGLFGASHDGFPSDGRKLPC